MDQDCIKLASYFGERRRILGSFTSDALADLDGAGEISASVLLLGTEGSGLRHHFRTSRSQRLSEDVPAVAEAVAVGSSLRIEEAFDRALNLNGSGLISLRRARLLSGEIDPVGLWDKPDEATKLTVYLSPQDRVYQVPASEVICELLHRRGMAGATVLAGIDGALCSHNERLQLVRRNVDAPMMVIAVGSGDRLGLILPELGGLLRHPLITLEQVRICKRQGQLISPPSAMPDTGADGRPLWQKLTVYARDSTRHDGQSIHGAIVRRLRAAGISAITLRGLWGFRSDHAPHGGRHVPGVTVVLGIPERMTAAFSVIDELTTARGLVTSETVTIVRSVNRHA